MRWTALLARLLKQRTMLGQYLDPVADKLLLSTLFLVLMYKALIPARVTVLVFGRDVGILVVAAILYAAAGRREFSPSIFGKGQHTGPGGRCGCRDSASDQRHALGGRSAERWRWTRPSALTVASGLHYAWMAARRAGAQPVNGNGGK